MKTAYMNVVLLLLALMTHGFSKAQTIELEDGFENGLSAWTQETVSGTNVWSVQSGDDLLFPKGTVEGKARAYFQTNNMNRSVVKLVSEKINATRLGRPLLTFSYALPAYPSGAHDALRLYYRVNSGEWSLLQEYNETANAWTYVELLLPPEVQSPDLPSRSLRMRSMR